MASQFPKLPGYVTTHDPTIVNHKKVSHVKLDGVRNAKNTDVSLYSVPKPPTGNFKPEKAAASKSLSHTQFAHAGETQEQFEPVYVKLDKQVSIELKNLRALMLLQTQKPGRVSVTRFASKELGAHVTVTGFLNSILTGHLISNLFIIGLAIPRLLQGERC